MIDFLFEGEADTIQRLVHDKATQESCAPFHFSASYLSPFGFSPHTGALLFRPCSLR